MINCPSYQYLKKSKINQKKILEFNFKLFKPAIKIDQIELFLRF
jgi:hypothetical protein